MNKKKIIQSLIERLNKELVEAEVAFASARELATQDDLKSEGKYDTRAIEASYLAGAQGKRVEEIKLDIQMLEDIDITQTSSDKLQLGSLALIRYNNQDRYYFISSTSGGSLIMVDETPILVISVFSPIGDAALGLSKGETFEVETPKEARAYQILNIF